MKKPSIFLGCCLVLLVVGCSDNNVEPPAALVPIKTAVDVSEVWSHSIGAADAILYLGIVASTDGTNVYAASNKGDVYAYRIKDGNKLWKVDTDYRFTGGPGVGDGLVVVAARDGTVLALDSATGAQKWRVSVNDEILAVPAIGGGMVVVHATDGHIIALSERSGQQIWYVSQEPPKLTLRGSAAPVIEGGSVYAGLNNGKLLALNLADGSQVWERTISAPTGNNELSRLSDLDGVVAYDSGKLFAVNYQGKVAEISTASGDPLWMHEMSSYTGVSTDDRFVYVSDASGAVWALDKSSGNPAWTQPALHARDVTLPVPYMGTVVVGDLQGYLHFMSASDGTFVARVRVDSDPIQAPPVVAGGLLIALSTDGELAAYRISKPYAGK